MVDVNIQVYIKTVYNNEVIIHIEHHLIEFDLMKIKEQIKM